MKFIKCLYCHHLPCNCPLIQRAAATLDTEETRKQIQKHGHKGILTMDQESKMETVSTMKADFVAPKSARVRLRGMYYVQPTVRNYSLDMYFRRI